MKFFYKILFLFVLAIIFLFGFKNLARAEAGYDLKAESLTMASVKCEINQTCLFTARVKNLGDSFTMNFSPNPSVAASNLTEPRISFSPSQGAAIKTNDYIIFSIYAAFTGIGAVDMTFKLDPSGFLAETNTDNNSVALRVNVGGYDLAAESITMVPTKPMVKQASYLRIKVKNNGSYNLYTGTGTDSIKSFPDFIITSASSTTPSLSRIITNGDYLYYEYEGYFSSAGDKKFSFTIDPGDSLKEANSANNTVAVTISVLTAADTDLSIDSLSFSPAKPLVGQPVDITVGIKNTGKTSLTSGLGFSESEVGRNFSNFNFSPISLTVDAYPTLGAPLNPSEVFHYVYHGIFSQSGRAAMNFNINKNNALIESSQANNSTSTAAVVYNNLDEANNFAFIGQKLVFASSTTAIVSWSTSVATAGKIYYGLKNGNINANRVEAAVSGLNSSITIDNLIPGADYNYQIVAKNDTLEKQDTAGSFSMPPNNLLAINFSPVVKVLNKTATFSWATNLISSSLVYYKKQGVNDLSGAGGDTLTADHKIELKDLATGLYDYFLSSTSTPGTNIKTSWAVFEIKDAVVPAPIAPAAPAAADNPPPAASAISLTVGDDKLHGRLKGKIILKVESQGEAYYVSPKDKKIYYLGKPEDAFPVIRSQGVGITNANLMKIPVGFSGLSGADADSDGLPDAQETALGTDLNKADTDNDGYKDKDELNNGYSPLIKAAKMNYDLSFVAGQKGKIFLQVESLGQAWYINPSDGKRYFLSRPADAFSIMRQLGVGISNSDFTALSK